MSLVIFLCFMFLILLNSTCSMFECARFSLARIQKYLVGYVPMDPRQLNGACFTVPTVPGK